MNSVADLATFYQLLADLAGATGGPRVLSACSGGSGWPARGVYFFFEPGERRSAGGRGPRVVRVGTHGLKRGSRTTLWKRLAQHAGTRRSGGGNHRGSIFRLLVGNALVNRAGAGFASWGVGSSRGEAARKLGTASAEIHRRELPLEIEVSRVIGAMPFVWLPVGDEPGPDSLRGYIERNSIALLSCRRDPMDPPSADWLGSHCDRDAVRQSGLWNNNHVDEEPDPGFLPTLAALVKDVTPGTRRRAGWG